MTPTSGIEFLVWLLIAATVITILAKRLRIIGGLLLGTARIPLLSPRQMSS